MKLKQLLFPHDAKSGHHKALDGLRGWAVLLVLLGHGTNQGLSPWLEGTFFARGKLGVYLFFVISAYLLDKQILQVWKQGKGSWSYWRYYIGRRFFRIFPPFLLALITFRMMNEAGFKVVMHTWDQVLHHLLLLRGDHIFWSIPTEFLYYLLSPVLLYLCLRLFKLRAVPTLLFFILLALGSIVLNALYDLPRFNTMRYLGVFAVGTLLAGFEVLFPVAWKAVVKGPWITVLAAAAMGIFLYWGWVAKDFTDASVYVPVAVLWGVLSLASFKVGWWQSFLSWTPFRWVGTVSYSLYLFHIPVLMWVKSLGLDATVAWGLFLFLSVVLASILHLGIERPALSWVKRK